jgi:hypothetical protein
VRADDEDLLCGFASRLSTKKWTFPLNLFFLVKHNGVTSSDKCYSLLQFHREKDTVVLKGYQIFHNHVRPHMALKGGTSAELCGIEVKGRNKWITLIQNASQKHTG